MCDGKRTQRLERAGAFGIIFEKIEIDRAVAKQFFRHDVVAAFGLPVAHAVAAAQVQADAHVLRRPRDDGVDDIDIVAQQRLPVVAARRQRGADFLVAEFRDRGLVELHIAAAGIVKLLQFDVIGRDQVGPERRKIRIDVAADARAAGAEMDVARAGQGDLRRQAGAASSRRVRQSRARWSNCSTECAP